MSHIQLLTRSILLVFLIHKCVCTSENAPSVKVEAGTITGITMNVVFQQKKYELDRYIGIPYAKPPVKELRFKKPEPYGMFTETFSATKFGPSCPQYEYLSMGIEKTSEDCLFLNIYVPRQEPDKTTGHAVMLFLHGGGFTSGTGNMYNGEILASAGNVIVVTINYRLGVFGFLDTGDKNSEGNYGLWDQRFALQWVNRNIGVFGGDKDRVTLFGESAGSVSVALQMLYPQNKGLFINGITQSGAPTLASFVRENNIDAAKYYAENMSCSIENMDEVFKCLKYASLDDIMKVASVAFESGDMASAMKVSILPTLDGNFFKDPEILYKKSKMEVSPEIEFFRSLKLMNGINGLEGAVYLLMLGKSDLEDLEITREEMLSEHIFGAVSVVLRERDVPDVYKQLLISEYTNWENPDDPKRIREELVRFLGDIYINIPVIELSQVHCNASNVDSYFYNFLPPVDKTLLPTPSWIKQANHGDELGPVFGYGFDFKKLFNISNYSPPAWELNLSERMITYWTNFAKTGDPNLPSSEATSLVWPKYNITSQAYMKFDKEDSTGQYVLAREFDLWRNILPTLLEATDHAKTITSKYGKKEQETCEQDGNC